MNGDPKLPDFLRVLIESPPRASEGVHSWLFRVARQLHAHLPVNEIISLLEDRTRDCGRHVPKSEIEDAVKNSISWAWQPSGRHSQALKRRRRWPSLDRKLRESIVNEHGYGLADLWELANPRFEDSQSHCESIIDRLFPGNPLLCCGKSKFSFDTRHREAWRGELAELQVMVPSPMTAATGLTKEGKVSAHSLDNTGPRRFLIVEFDTGRADDHAALLLHLGTYAPLVCAMHSAGKSLHGWFLVEGQSEERTLRFFRYAVSLGADSQLWSRSQFVRMPDGTRDNGKRQTVFFLNYHPLEDYAKRGTQG